MIFGNGDIVGVFGGPRCRANNGGLALGDNDIAVAGFVEAVDDHVGYPGVHRHHDTWGGLDRDADTGHGRNVAGPSPCRANDNVGFQPLVLLTSPIVDMDATYLALTVA